MGEMGKYLKTVGGPQFICGLPRAICAFETIATLRAVIFAVVLAVASAPANSQEDDQQILVRLQTVAQSGDREAEFRLGEHLFLKIRDPNRATIWFKKAADKGHLVAMWWLGKDNYFSPEGLEYLRRSAEGGYAPSQYLYASRSRLNLKKMECGEYVMWLEKAANGGEINAINSLIEESLGADNSDRCLKLDDRRTLALRLRAIRMSESRGLKDAHNKYQLGLMYLNGQGTEANPEKALELIKASAELAAGTVAEASYRPTFYKLHEMYAKGISTTVDREKSRYWLNLYFKTAPQPVH